MRFGKKQASKTYDEWVDILKYLQSHRVDHEYLEALRPYGLSGQAQLTDRFCAQVESCTNVLLRKAVNVCSRRIGEALEEGDYAHVTTLITRLYRDEEQCCFFRYLSFLPVDFVTELNGQVRRELNRYCDFIIDNLRAEPEGPVNVYLDSELFKLRRKRLFIGDSKDYG